ncbi:hypothetical protein HTY52_22840 [Cupriavidus taiwanensis]|uniref:hypothetical protein n=1 Tax=Cupriavidus taiwanensis TaxID=164546 RepID=UPI001572AAB3|nr:hypothetical protein [Cupriavidus taiwanensis]NSX16933.1 hypothetical protein [Cupriavidus taiwanensis]
MQEFPKCLYQGGDVSAEFAIAHDPEQEAIARQAGFAMAGEGGEKTSDMVAEAEALGVKVDKRWKAERLAEEIAKAKA